MSFNEFNIHFFAVKLAPDTSPQLILTTTSRMSRLHCFLGVPSTLRKIGLGSGAIGATESPELEA